MYGHAVAKPGHGCTYDVAISGGLPATALIVTAATPGTLASFSTFTWKKYLRRKSKGQC